MNARVPVGDLARGKWSGILQSFGLGREFLTGKHGPCPLCNGGRDRFRWDNKDGNGSYICGQCGAGSGMDLLMKFKGWDFRTAAVEVEGVVGAVRTRDKPKPVMTEQQQREAKRALWLASKPVVKGDIVDRYLTARGVGFSDYPEALRTCEKAQVAPRQWIPAMVAVVVDREGKPVSLHRTYLQDGDKADVESPRRLMPGEIPKGSCIRLSGLRSEICLAEGIETALSVEKLFQTPCWAVLNTSMLKHWVPPEGVESVTIFADHDGNWAGHAAAYTLGHRLRVQGLDANVRVPPNEGEDWNDVLRQQSMKGETS